ncbi:MAG: hypothetical protein H5U24_07565 [Thioclava marina]|uniref:hypothetical protein n=1 Tax=Thioclava marina TaxID=1915077 RepID=UPI0019CE86CA|nr:hypothetical protein [Thioclava marina]MBC7145249.1 hypothetical protein [Thioclava marina]
MVPELKLFFKDYPRQILDMKGVSPAELPPGLMDRLRDYRERSLAILEDAQVFRIDINAYWMMSELVNEMKRDGLDELFSHVQLPFPTMIIMPPLIGADGIMRQNDGSVLGLVTQVDDEIYTQRFAIRQNTVGPSLCCMITKGMGASTVPTPTRELFEAVGMPVSDGMIEEELAMNRSFLASAVGIATLLRHEGMLDVKRVSLHPRHERRQAERSGKVLPDTLITRIALGKAGRGQVEAMKDHISADRREGMPRRTHWVRGHYMKSKSGKLVWRMPHLRGAGPLVPQLRYVTGSASTSGLAKTPQVDDS